ncbi:unnamed protein product, partial [Trichogramma brassicae]
MFKVKSKITIVINKCKNIYIGCSSVKHELRGADLRRCTLSCILHAMYCRHSATYFFFHWCVRTSKCLTEYQWDDSDYYIYECLMALAFGITLGGTQNIMGLLNFLAVRKAKYNVEVVYSTPSNHSNIYLLEKAGHAVLTMEYTRTAPVLRVVAFSISIYIYSIPAMRISFSSAQLLHVFISSRMFQYIIRNDSFFLTFVRKCVSPYLRLNLCAHERTRARTHKKPLENQEAVSRLLLTFDPGSRTKQRETEDMPKPTCCGVLVWRCCTPIA